MAIMPFIYYKDGILKYNNKIVDVKIISEQLGENYDVFRKIISSIIKKEVLGKLRDNLIHIKIKSNNVFVLIISSIFVVKILTEKFVINL